MIRIGLVLLFLASFLWAGQSDQLIRISGSGEVSFQPDIAVLSIGIERLVQDPAKGQAMVSQKVSNYLKEISRLIESEQVKTKRLSIRRKTEYRNRKQEFVGYQIRQILSITVKDFKLLGKLIDMGVQSGMNSLQDVVFDHSNPDQYTQQALVKALQQVASKVDVIAKEMGLRSVRLKEINEQQIHYQPFRNAQVSNFKALAASERSSTQVLADDLKATARIQAVYKFRK